MPVTTGKGAPERREVQECESCTEARGLQVGWMTARVREQGSGYLHVLVDVVEGVVNPKRRNRREWCVGKSIDVGPALNPPQSSLGALLCTLFSHPPTMSSSAIYAVSPSSPSLLPSPDLSHFLYTAQESPTNRPARPRALPTTFTYSSLRVSRYHQIRVRCPFTGHSSPPHSAG